MRGFVCSRLGMLAILLGLGWSAGRAGADLIVDAGFEDPTPLGSFGSVVGPPFQVGYWGTENGQKVGAENGVTPFEGSQMLRMTEVSAHTQTWQAVDLTPYASQIDAGNFAFTFGAWYNIADTTQSARAIASVYLFDSAYGWPSATAFVQSYIDTDTDPTTWEFTSVFVNVPAGVRYALVQVHYADLYGLGRPVYVDGVQLDIIPAPSSLALALVGILAVSRRHLPG